MREPRTQDEEETAHRRWLGKRDVAGRAVVPSTRGRRGPRAHISLALGGVCHWRCRRGAPKSKSSQVKSSQVKSNKTHPEPRIQVKSTNNRQPITGSLSNVPVLRELCPGSDLDLTCLVLASACDSHVSKAPCLRRCPTSRSSRSGRSSSRATSPMSRSRSSRAGAGRAVSTRAIAAGTCRRRRSNQLCDSAAGQASGRAGQGDAPGFASRDAWQRTELSAAEGLTIGPRLHAFGGR